MQEEINDNLKTDFQYPFNIMAKVNLSEMFKIN